jgi:hypothetical protein
MTSPRSAILEIMQAIDAVDVDQSAKQKFRQMVSVVGAGYGYAWLERSSRIDFARELLLLRVPRPQIRDRLVATFGISRPQAYRVISEALQLSHG